VFGDFTLDGRALIFNFLDGDLLADLESRTVI
jgi:hypothetical protein